MSRLRKTVIPFSWNTITMAFTEGTAASVSLTAFLRNPYNYAITYTVSGTLPSGVTHSNGVVSYNGTGSPTTASVKFVATSSQYQAVSASTTVTITAAPVVNNPPVWITPAGSIGTFPNSGGVTRTVQLQASDADGDPLTYSRTGSTADTAPGTFTVSSTGLVTVPEAVAAATYTLEVRVSDGRGGTATRQFTATVQSIINPTVRNIYYNGDFSSAGVPSASSLNGGGYMGCKYNPEGVDVLASQAADSHFSSSNDSTYLPNMEVRVISAPGVTPIKYYHWAVDPRLDCRVLQSETWNGTLVTPRSGTHFMRQAIYYTKQYECLNGATDPSPADDKPRVKFDLSNDVYDFDWDQEMWFGFSIYLPPDYEGETASKANLGTTMVFVLNGRTPPGVSGTDYTQCTLGRSRSGTQTVENWNFIYQVNSTVLKDMSGADGVANQRYVSLGPTNDSRGKWTDFVFRIRFNPFTTTTNPAAAGISGARNQTFAGNQGIMQIWKGIWDGVNPTAMTRYHSVVNAPVGGVPAANILLGSSYRMYKFGWKNSNNPTSSTKPKYHGYDVIRWGWASSTIAANKGQPGPTRSQDVNPSGEALV